MVTSAYPYRTIDLYTVTVNDLTFKVPFKITAQRDDYIHALISYFDISFDACHKPIEFSTGPHAKYTHWKQTVFYLKEAITIKAGETIQGTFSLGPNAKNERDLDIVVDYEFKGENGDCTDSIAYKMC